MWSGLWGISVGLIMTKAGCAAAKQSAGDSVRSMLVGKSEQEISARADELRRRLEEGEKVRLIYRDEPSVLERSFPSARGTVTCPHHGCEAHVILQDDRTAQVEYYPVPDADGDCDHCDRIFVRCNP
ncbi:MAG TPA: hypothetical protein VNI35_03030 [Nitrospira sp.]|nr:hypothetical protein [Nitrospira sp.]